MLSVREKLKREAMKAEREKLEAQLALEIRALKLPEPEREYRFMPGRRWRFDFAWPEFDVAVEVEGGIFSGGRHTRGRGYTNDCEKYNAAALHGWRVLRVTAEHIINGKARHWMQVALAEAAA